MAVIAVHDSGRDHDHLYCSRHSKISVTVTLQDTVKHHNYRLLLMIENIVKYHDYHYCSGYNNKNVLKKISLSPSLLGFSQINVTFTVAMDTVNITLPTRGEIFHYPIAYSSLDHYSIPSKTIALI